jgi:hypothetical protein
MPAARGALPRDAVDDATWLRLAYVFTLDREPDEAAWQYYLEAFHEGRLARDEVLDTMRHAVERRFQVNPRDLLRSLRTSEAAWVRSLPLAPTVVDLREGSAGDDRSLIGSGWPGLAAVRVLPAPAAGLIADLVIDRREQPDVASAATCVAPGGTLAVIAPNAVVTGLPADGGSLRVAGGTTLESLEAELAAAGCTVATRHGLNWAGPSLSRGSAHVPELAWRVGVHGAPEQCVLLAVTARRQG